MICDVISRGDLEAYVFGEAAPEIARRVEAHLFGCTECAAEMRLLRGERRLFRARLEEPAPAVPSFESLLARLDSEPAIAAPEQPAPVRPVVRRVPAVESGVHRRSRIVTAVTAFIAAAAAVGTLWWRHPETPSERAGETTAESEAPEIVAESVCGSGEDPNEVVRIPVSEEPTASIDLSLKQRSTEAVGRRQEDLGACSPGAHDVCGNSDAPMTYACEDSVEWCAASRQ